MKPEPCEHAFECRVRSRYKELCFDLMSDKDKEALGGSCPVAEEYSKIPEDYLVCPTGIVRRLMRGDTIKGERL